MSPEAQMPNPTESVSIFTQEDEAEVLQLDADMFELLGKKKDGTATTEDVERYQVAHRRSVELASKRSGIVTPIFEKTTTDEEDAAYEAYAKKLVEAQNTPDE